MGQGRQLVEERLDYGWVQNHSDHLKGEKEENDIGNEGSSRPSDDEE